jgi:hypothetical protein
MTKKAWLFCVCFMLSMGLSAQTAGFLDALLDAPRVSFSQAALVVLPAAGILDPRAGPEEAFAKAREWLPRQAAMDAPIRMGELSYLVMGAFGFKGGLMYTLFPGPRYAYRELLHLKIIQGRADGSFTVSGERLLQIISQTLRHSGEDARLDAALAAGGEAPAAEAAIEAAAEAPGAEERMEVPDGEGLSTGAEGLLPYKGDFEIE